MFKLNPSPTFKASIKITVPGSDPVPIEFEFKHRSRAGLAEWQKSFQRTVTDAESPDGERIEVRRDEELIPEYIAGWSGVIGDDGLPVPFSVEAVLKLGNNYHAAPMEIYIGYLKALQESRTKN